MYRSRYSLSSYRRATENTGEFLVLRLSALLPPRRVVEIQAQKSFFGIWGGEIRKKFFCVWISDRLSRGEEGQADSRCRSPPPSPSPKKWFRLGFVCSESGGVEKVGGFSFFLLSSSANGQNPSAKKIFWILGKGGEARNPKKTFLRLGFGCPSRGGKGREDPLFCPPSSTPPQKRFLASGSRLCVEMERSGESEKLHFFGPSPSTNDPNPGTKKFFLGFWGGREERKSKKNFFASGFRPSVEGKGPKKCNDSLSPLAFTSSTGRRKKPWVSRSSPSALLSPLGEQPKSRRKKVFLRFGEERRRGNRKKNFFAPGFRSFVGGGRGPKKWSSATHRGEQEIHHFFSDPSSSRGRWRRESNCTSSVLPPSTNGRNLGAKKFFSVSSPPQIRKFFLRVGFGRSSREGGGGTRRSTFSASPPLTSD